ncbi:MAG: ATP-binding cassette domain-containing protein [Actinobacteria bacterium]|nr:ATP-binding cassette domain-containing protein [Actinomycetota bacterium]
MIRFDHVSFTYPDADAPTLVDVDFMVPEGELCLVVGETGSGKSTLLRAVNGLVPRFSGGLLTGVVTVGGRSTAQVPPRELADVVGMVGQDPAAGFVTDVVEDELAHVMENLGVAPDVMRRRVEDVLDLLGLHELRTRPLSTLSGGQQQRVAIGAVLTAGPRVLVLDEPTSALDPAAAEEVLAAVTRLVHDLGITVLVAEHRLERVVQYADSVVFVPGDGAPVVIGDPSGVLAGSTVVPPVVELGRLAGWSPLPLSVRDARRESAELRARLAPLRPPAPSVASPGSVVAEVRGLRATYGQLTALSGVDLEVRAGEIVALMGRNGAGKSTLLTHLVGLRAPQRGTVEVCGAEPHRQAAREVIRSVGLVPQDSGMLLYHDTVAAECVAADRDGDLAAGTTRAVLDRLVPGIDHRAHPRDLSEGQRLALALAIVLGAEPALVLLDEPTRGLDYAAKQRLIVMLQMLAADGRAVVLATHDVEVVASVAHRAVVLAEGEVVADGAARDVVVHSPVFAPQIAKVLAPETWMNVGEVRAALDALEGPRR